jgi:phosphoglucosamine mutase
VFGTSGIRGPVGEAVTADLALAVGRAVATAGADRVVVGRDVRESGAVLSDAVAAGLRECGADVVDLGLASTPTIARAVGQQDADSGVVVTASHNPPADNGLKLWNPSGQAFDERQRAEIERIVGAGEYDLAGWNDHGDLTRWDGAEDYHVRALVDATPPAEDCSVVVDVGNGVGALTARALDELGCTVRTLDAQPDGTFPARPSEPTAENCGTLRAVVAATDADLGIAHDGDADRMRAVAADGTFVPQDALLALFAREAAGPGDCIAAPVNASLMVEDALAAVGAELVRTRVGDVFVAERAAQPDVVFGGEPSGAWIWPGETLCPDGPLAACKLVSLVDARGPLSSLLDALDAYPIERGHVETSHKAAVMDRVREQILAEYGDAETADGVRVELDDGWFLVRASGTQPLVRVTAEARKEERARQIFEDAEALVREAADGI